MAYLGLSPEPVSNLTQPWENAQMPIFYTEVQMTPQQIEAQVKQIQPAQGGGLVLAAIAALLILGA